VLLKVIKDTRTSSLKRTVPADRTACKLSTDYRVARNTGLIPLDQSAVARLVNVKGSF
jgi:hypothetical protein